MLDTFIHTVGQDTVVVRLTAGDRLLCAYRFNEKGVLS
jgi:hypothetical protein